MKYIVAGLVLAVLLALAATSQAEAQWLDPDSCWTCVDTREHFVGGAAVAIASRPVLKKAWQRVAATAVLGAVYEAGQWDAHRADGLNGQRGYGFGPKDLVADVAGAVVSEGLVTLFNLWWRQH